MCVYIYIYNATIKKKFYNITYRYSIITPVHQDKTKQTSNTFKLS